MTDIDITYVRPSRMAKLRPWISAARRILLARLKSPLNADEFLGWTDTLWLAGCAVLIRGVAMWCVPLAWILSGASLMFLAWVMGRVASMGEKPEDNQ